MVVVLQMYHLVPAFRSSFRCAARPRISLPIFIARRALTSSSQGPPSETLAVIHEPDTVEPDTIEPDAIDKFEPESIGEEGDETPRSYQAFMEKIGYQYRFASPLNWLGQRVPFPMNPSFRPPPPISDRQREIMWKLFARDSGAFSVSRLAKRFNLSKKRVDGILRLKGMEKDWIKGKELQTGFLQGMESLLNAQTHVAIPQMAEILENRKVIRPGVLLEKLDVHRADMLEQVEKRDATPYRYERSYWESIPEDADEPILPNILHHVKQRAETKRILEGQKKKEAFMENVPRTQLIKRPKRRIMVRYRKNGPATKFVDIGAEFVDVKELTKRASVAARKSRMRARKALEKKAALDARRSN